MEKSVYQKEEEERALQMGTFLLGIPALLIFMLAFMAIVLDY